MRKRYLFLSILLIVSMLIGCTPETTKPDNENSDQTDTKKEEPLVTKTIPKDFPIDKVPLYEVESVDGVITVGKDYYQIYYFSNKDRREIFDHYKEVFADDKIEPYENEFAYELRGDIDDYKLKLHILPSTETEYQSTVILFLFKEEAKSDNS